MSLELHWRQERLNAWTHGIGALLSLVGGAILIAVAATRGDGWQLAGAAVFGFALLLVYTSSTLYHSARDPVAKRRLKIFDHCAIYVLIAGTYTPFAIIGLRGHGGGWLLAVVWALAAAGIVFKLFFTGRFKLVSTAIYLAMGWLAVAEAKPMIAQLSLATLAWLLAGGLLYSAGTLFYLNRRLQHAHAIWHGFVLLGSGCHFVAVSLQVLI